jgi:hypothetical protein
MIDRILEKIFPSLIAMDRFSHEDVEYIPEEMPSKEKGKFVDYKMQ